ncbi:MAG: hypothetical protein AB1696_25280 [Planctomycetota bacterium]
MVEDEEVIEFMRARGYPPDPSGRYEWFFSIERMKAFDQDYVADAPEDNALVAEMSESHPGPDIRFFYHGKPMTEEEQSNVTRDLLAYWSKEKLEKWEQWKRGRE